MAIPAAIVSIYKGDGDEFLDVEGSLYLTGSGYMMGDIALV